MANDRIRARDRAVLMWALDNMSDPLWGFDPDLSTCPSRRAYDLLLAIEGDSDLRNHFVRKVITLLVG